MERADSYQAQNADYDDLHLCFSVSMTEVLSASLEFRSIVADSGVRQLDESS
jgi:hypothetical protein